MLDFGISAGPPLDGGLTEAGRVLGTPAYLAPEQIRGEPARPQADLYALGVMLYQALSRRLPHEADGAEGLLRARLIGRPPPPLLSVAPATPGPVAEVVDALLLDDPARRPRSAIDVLAQLSGRAALGQRPALPRLGGDGPARALAEALLEGRPADLVGPAGSGRSRCLREACALLEAAGRRPVRLAPGGRPYESLAPLLGSLDELGDAALDAVAAHVDARLRAALDAGVVLRALFVGPDRLFHLREDAARTLLARTGGLPAGIELEAAAWVRAGVAAWEDDRLAVRRDALDALDADLGRPLHAAPSAGPPIEPPHLRDILAWAELGREAMVNSTARA